MKMPVETGTLVKPGDLLVQIETRDVQNQYDQAAAALDAAQSQLEVADAAEEARRRAVQGPHHHRDRARDRAARLRERAVGARRGAHQPRPRQAAPRGRDGARAGRRHDHRQDRVARHVITSATGAFGGGTTLLKMADLGQVRIRALFNETDIGQVQPGPDRRPSRSTRIPIAASPASSRRSSRRPSCSRTSRCSRCSSPSRTSKGCSSRA